MLRKCKLSVEKDWKHGKANGKMSLEKKTEKECIYK